ncbi:RcnB family protein [Luteimonas wenzhouensis]|jgi:Ni/Co efflux regulator RcnB|uniref:RcnB family protein n=1 Tax=Luteimonas wenzhouensis TaxID=2599615 RepID=A0A5C5U7Z3_9GAMM|nr:RcnB family protein [Luteimonas wenzhouensis]NLW96723.1 RcnB family protein [Xanthomonadaceae bacterium]TWT22086.1 RcnB family protein [Luteimonas wenzhouensis]
MNLKFTWATVLAVAMATMAAPAVADGRGRGHGYRDHDRRELRHDRRDHRQARYDRRDHRRHDRHHRAPVRVVHHRPVVHHYHAPPRHVGPPRWARGGYVHHYHRPVYVIHDYHGYGLRHPPHGYRWVRDDYGDMLLVAIATGLIVDMILR